MGMVGNFVAIRPTQLQGFLDAPDSVESFLYGDADDREPANHLDIDKSWQGIHFLLTGDAWAGAPPLALAILGGIEVGGDVGYGPARYLTPAEVKQVASALAAVSRHQLAAKYSSASFIEADIYPEIWDEGDEALDYLLVNFDALIEFYRQASIRGDAVLKYLN